MIHIQYCMPIFVYLSVNIHSRSIVFKLCPHLKLSGRPIFMSKIVSSAWKLNKKQNDKQTSMTYNKPTCYNYLCTIVSKSLSKQMITCLLI